MSNAPDQVVVNSDGDINNPIGQSTVHAVVQNNAKMQFVRDFESLVYAKFTNTSLSLIKDCINLRSLTIEENKPMSYLGSGLQVKNIACFGCDKLSTVTLTSMEYGRFEHCPSLKFITAGENLCSLILYNCATLSNLLFLKGIKLQNLQSKCAMD